MGPAWRSCCSSIPPATPLSFAVRIVSDMDPADPGPALPSSGSSTTGYSAEGGRVKLARAPAGTGRRTSVPRQTIAIPVQPPRRLPWHEWLAEGLYVVFERAVAAAALVLVSPIMLLEAIAIRCDSPGHVLFRHDRAGRSRPTLGRDLLQRSDLRPPDGEFQPDQWYWVPMRFRFVKFRTMYRDALDRFPELYWWNYDIDYEDFQNYYHNLDDDPRVTRVGRFLRKTSLDELVNFWHVLTGECRLVGPRPEIPDIVTHYTADEMKKFTVKPGLTCLWAIRGRSELSVREKNQLDLEYVDSRSVLLDLKILVLTVRCVLTRRGAY